MRFLTFAKLFFQTFIGRYL